MSCASPKPIRGHQPASRGARSRQEEAGARVGVARLWVVARAMRKDGGRFLAGLQEAGWGVEKPALPSSCFTAELRQT
jgi:hypothetical protein